jgi:hypothetical protein
MTDQPTFRCTVRDGKFVEPCSLLSSACEYGNPRGKQKGVFAWELHTPKGPTRTMFGVKSGEHIFKGVMFNFCPFCGERIDAPFAQDQSDTDE